MPTAVWKDFIAPLLKRPRSFQVAALCYRHGGSGPEILLVTSRRTRRWVLPKGWPISGMDGGGAAAREAWEEAGVIPADRRPLRIGRYSYDKLLDGGLPALTDVDVYAIEVAGLESSYREAGERERRWMSPEEAAASVAEPELQELLRDLPVLPRSDEAA